MGKMQDSTTLVVREPSLVIKPIAGWSWYCGYHDTYGIGDDEDEVLWMAGAHMYYKEADGDVCEIYTREWEVRKEA
jgi:hypothetical protein